jgi:hypothetical protein
MLGIYLLGMTGADPRVALREAATDRASRHARRGGFRADGRPDDDCRSRRDCTGFVETPPAPDLPRAR